MGYTMAIDSSSYLGWVLPYPSQGMDEVLGGDDAISLVKCHEGLQICISLLKLEKLAVNFECKIKQKLALRISTSG